MRRAAVAVIIGGYAFWAIGSGPGHQPVAVGARLAAAVTPAKPGRPDTAATKTVKYDGYTVSVPANWPVYDLSRDPRQCLRYDVHAVYLGTPGPDQACPPHVTGRVDTLLIEGSGPGRAGPKAGGDRKGPLRAGQRALAPGTIVQDPDLHEMALAMPDAAPQVDATYGTDSGAIEQMLATIRQASIPAAAPRRAGDALHATRHPVVVETLNPRWPKNPGPPPTWAASWLKNPGPPPAWAGAWLSPPRPPATAMPIPEAAPAPKPTGPVPADNPAPAPAPSAPAPPAPSASAPAPSAPSASAPAPSAPSASAPAPSAPHGAMAGFDTCAAPSLPTMRAWRARYSAIGIYIGGQMMGCGQSNLSAGWVRQTEAMGWSLMPTFVGLQAPCDSFSGKINPRQAAAQGTAAANQAIADATGYGLRARTPIYYDMEAYDHTKAGCRTAVLTFLDAWTRQLEASGYVSGVYSSADAAIIDLQSTTTIAGHSLAEPQAIWFALWDNAKTLTGTPYLTSAVWPVASRSKQYAGNRTVTVGGISLKIDADWVAGRVAR